MQGSDPPSQAEQSCPERGPAPGTGMGTGQGCHLSLMRRIAQAQGQDRAVTSSLMSVSTAAFSDSLRQIPARGLSLLPTLGHLSVEHSPGLSWGNYPAGMVGDVVSFHTPPLLGCSPVVSTSAHVLNFPFCTHRTQSLHLTPGRARVGFEPSLARSMQQDRSCPRDIPNIPKQR